MTDRITMDLAERRAADRELASQRADARRDYVRYAEQEAAADREYAVTLATTHAQLRATGKMSQGSIEVAAKAEAAEAKHRRDIAHSLARASLLRIQEIERKSVSVRDIHSTSERIDGLAA